jgi:hypothetical protein
MADLISLRRKHSAKNMKLSPFTNATLTNNKKLVITRVATNELGLKEFIESKVKFEGEDFDIMMTELPKIRKHFQDYQKDCWVYLTKRRVILLTPCFLIVQYMAYDLSLRDMIVDNSRDKFALNTQQVIKLLNFLD